MQHDENPPPVAYEIVREFWALLPSWSKVAGPGFTGMLGTFDMEARGRTFRVTVQELKESE